MLNILANPHMSIEDFQKVGLSINNTSLEDENVYKNSKIIQENPLFQNEDGQFDEAKFHQAYIGASYGLQDLAKQNQDFKPVYSKYNIFAPTDQVDWMGDKPELVKVANPDRITKSMITLGQNGSREYTPSEIAQSQKVWDSEKQEWMDTPENMFSFGKLFSDIGGFFHDNFDSTKVLATYDEDVDINGKKRGEVGFNENLIEHTKGEYMLNDNGTYYYRTLKKGENIYDKQVLHYSDILTREGSALNSIDFLDSDDIRKSTLGSFVKDASLIGAFFLPYVGPAIAGATIFQQAAGLGATLGKIALGSDSQTMNWIEGLVKSTNPMETRSEWSSVDYNNTGRRVSWTVENLLGMVGDVVGQLYQQRLLFKYAPVAFKGKWGLSEKNQALLKEQYINELKATKKDNLNKLVTAVTQATNETERALAKKALMKAQTSLDANVITEAGKMLEAYMKSYYKDGEELSKAYMTLLTVNDIYGEAKEAGASDFDAALITAGYAAMEYWLLSTDIGKWILPELRAERLRNKAILKSYTKDVKESFEKLGAEAATSEQAKRTYLQHVIDWGKSKAKAVFNGEFANGLGKRASIENGEGLLKAGMGSLIAGGLAEGIEETSEELLGDFSRALFNGLQQLKGNDNVKLKPFENAFDRYALSFLGGFAGGGISSATFDFSNIRQSLNMNYNQAVQELISKARNNELGESYELLDKEEIGNKNLSARKTIDDGEGGIIWQQGTESDNQDKAIKDAARRGLQLIEQTLDAHGGNMPDQEFLSVNTLRDFRFRALQNTTTAGRFLQHYNELVTELVETVSNLNNEKSILTKLQKGETDKDKSTEFETKIKKYEKRIKELDEEIDNFTSGKMAPLFMTSALLESTPYILAPFMDSSFRFFAERETKKKFEDIPSEELDTLMKKYQNHLKTEKKNEVAFASDEYINMQRLIKQSLKESVKLLQQSNPEIETFLGGLNMSLDLINFSDLDDEQYQVAMQEFAQANGIDVNTANNIKLLKNTYDEARQKIDDEYDLKIAEAGDSGIDDETLINTTDVYNSERRAAKEQLKNETAKAILDTSKVGQIKAALDRADIIIRQGYVNGAIKNKVLDGLRQIIQQIDQLEENIGLEQLEKITGDTEFSKHSREEVQDKIKQIEELPYTPIIANLDAFALTVKGMKISQVLDQFGKLLSGASSNISTFTLSPEQYKALDEALRVIDQYISALEGARTDNVDPFRLRTNRETGEIEDAYDVWGINKTLNDIHRASPKIENDPWEDLPEIDGRIADMLILDAKSIKNLLKTYQKLYNINQGQKLNAQTRVSARAIYSIYKRVQRLLNNTEFPEGVNTSKLIQVIEGLEKLKKYSEAGTIDLTYEQQVEVERERIKLEDAIYDFFNTDNPELLTNLDLLKQIISPTKLTMWSSDAKLLTENSEEIDDSSFIGYLAAKASLKSSDLYSKFKDVISTNGNKAPIITQEIASSLQLANILQGNKISAIITAYRESMLEQFLHSSYDERKKILKNAGYDEAIAQIFATEVGSKYIQNFDLIPQYTNTTFIDGIPGAGKTEGVDYFTIKLTLQTHPEILQGKKAWVCHAGDTDGKESENLRDKIGLTEELSSTFTRESLLTHLSNQYHVPGKTLQSDEYDIIDGRIVPKWQFNQDIEIPSVIIIDEAQQMTQLELLFIDKFAREHGIAVIMSGDLNQSKTQAELKFSKSDYQKIVKEIKEKEDNVFFSENENDFNLKIELARNQVLHTFKLGFSMRTNNNQKSANVDATRVFMETPGAENLTLRYYQDEEQITGDRVVKSVDDVYPILDIMIKNLKEGEKITFAYYSESSDLYKALSANKKYWDYIRPVEGTALGQEGNYWIVEVDSDSGREAYLRDLYTAMSRAKIASIDFGKSADGVTLFEQQDQETHEERLSPAGIKRYSENRVKILSTVVSSSNDILYEERQKGELKSLGSAEVIREQQEREKQAADEEIRLRQEQAERERQRQIVEEQERKAKEEQKRQKRITQVKGSSDFVLPDDVTYTHSNGLYTLSDLIPVSQEWINKYGINPIPVQNGIAYIKQIQFIVNPDGSQSNTVMLYDENGNELEILNLNGLFGEIFNNKIDFVSAVEELSDEQKMQQLIDAVRNYKIYVDPSTFIYSINDGILTIETPNFNLTFGTLFSTFNDDEIKDIVEGITPEELQQIVKVDKLEVDGDSVTIFIDGEPYEFFSTQQFKSIFGDIIDFEWNPETEEVEEEPQEFEVSNEQQIQTELSQAAVNDDQVQENQERPDTAPTGMSIDDFNYYMFSNATFEYGTTTYDIARNTYQISNIPGRIDSLNGIQNVLQFGRLPQSATTDFAQARLILANLRRQTMSIKDKAELEQKIARYIGATGVYVRYAIKTSQFDDHKLGSYPEYSKMEKDSNEPSNGRAQINGESRNVNNRSLVAIIGTEEKGDLIELPLLTFNNPATLLTIKDNAGQYKYPIGRVYDEKYKEYKLTYSKKESHIMALKDVLNQMGTDPQYMGMANLIKLYTRSDRNIVFIHDQNWTIAKNLHSFGPQLHFDRGTFYDVNKDFIQISEENGNTWITLDELKLDGSIKVSNVMQYLNKTGTIQLPNGETKKIISHPKHPFILFTDKSVNHEGKIMSSDDDLVKEFIWLKQNPEAEQTVKLIYVLPPKFTFREYMDTLRRATNREAIFPLGNHLTSYRILENLMYDPDGHANAELEDIFKKAFGENIGSQLYLATKTLVDKLKDKSLSEQIRYLTTTSEEITRTLDLNSLGLLNLGSNTVAYKTLQNILKQLVYPARITVDGGMNYVGTDSIAEQQLQLLDNLFARSGKSLYYQTQADSTRTITSNNQFVLVKSVDNINEMKDHNYTVNGNISSSTYSVNPEFNQILDKLVNDTQNFGVNNGNAVQSYDNIPYTKGYSGFNVTKRGQITGNTPSLHSKVLNKLNKFGLTTEIQPTVKDDNSVETLQKIADEINSRQDKNKAMVYNGELIITSNPFFEGKQVEFRFDSNPGENGVNQQFDVIIDREEYDATFSNTDEGNILSLTKKVNDQQIVTQQEPTIELLHSVLEQINTVLQSNPRAIPQRVIQQLTNLENNFDAQIFQNIIDTPIVKNLLVQNNINVVENTIEDNCAMPTFKFKFV